MLLYNQVKRKQTHRRENKMKNLMKMETKVFNSLKRDLITWDEAQYCLYGYIHCMVDMGCITEDRGTEEMNRIVKRLLERK
jgi:hypothetical protein